MVVPALNLSNLLLLKIWGFWIKGGKEMKEEIIKKLLVIIIMLLVIILRLIEKIDTSLVVPIFIGQV